MVDMTQDFCEPEIQAEQKAEEDKIQVQPELHAKPSAEKPTVPEAKKPEFIPPPYKPKLPFPGRFKKELVAKYKALFDKQMKEIEVKMPLLDAIALIPQSHKFLKDLVNERIKETQGMMVLTHECSALIQGKTVLEKLGDPGCFTLPCSLGQFSFKDCLCDLGASISLMPLSLAKRLGFTTFDKCNIAMILADRSVRYANGILEDLPVRIGGVEIPTDFVVLEMDEGPKDPLLLGRPFLATAGAIIDCKRGLIELNLGKDFKMNFDIKDVMKRPTIDGQLFYIEMMDQLADELLEELNEQDHLQSALTKNGEDGYLHLETEAYQKTLDSHKEEEGSVVFEDLVQSSAEVMVFMFERQWIQSFLLQALY